MRFLSIIISIVLLISCSAEKGQETLSKELEEALYYFYRGESFEQQGRVYEAMDSFLKGEQIANLGDNYLLKGQISWYKGRLYANRLDYSNAIVMFTNAADYFEKGGKMESVMYSYSQMAAIFFKIKNYSSSKEYYKKSIDIAKELRDNMLYSPHDSIVRSKEYNFNKYILDYTTGLAEIAYRENNNADSALNQLFNVYKRFNDGKINKTNYILLSELYLQKGDIYKSKKFLDSAITYTHNVNLSYPYNIYHLYRDSIANLQVGYNIVQLLDVAKRIEKYSGNYKKSIEFMEMREHLADSLNYENNLLQISEAEKQFWLRLLEEENSNIKMRERYLNYIYILLILIIGGVVVYIVRRYRERDLKKSAQIEQLADDITVLGVRVDSAERGREYLLNQLDVQKEKERELKELLENRFSEVRELIRTYYEFGNSKKLQKKVDDLLKLKLSGDNFEVIEQVVNAKNDNIIARVREKYPTLKEDSIKLLTLVYAGFSAQEMSVILDDTPQNIYVRKSRLKKYILGVQENE